MPKTGLCFTIILVVILSLFARESSYTETFNQAKYYYEKEFYDSTISIIRDYLKDHGRDPETEFIVPLLLEALVRKNDIDYFNRLMNIYRRKFSKSAFMPRLTYLSGIIKVKEEEYKDAVIAFSDAISMGINPTLDSLAQLNIVELCSTRLTPVELSALSNQKLYSPVDEIVAYYEFKKLYEKGQIAKAKTLAEKFKDTYPRSSYLSETKKIINKTKILQKQTIQIGLLAPMSGENAEIGKYIVQAVQLAVDNYNKNHEFSIDLIISDTYGSMVETAKKTYEMIYTHRVQIIIGPILSSCATVAASLLMEHPEVIMITPTATDDGIAQLGDNIFQMNVTLGILGNRIARYAIENLNIREFAIMAPMTEYGRILSKNFAEEVLRLGGEIIVEEHFDQGANDFRMQFEHIREKMTDRRWEQMSLGEMQAGSEDKTKESYLKDSTIVIGGLFIPAESDDVIKIASQVYFHNIRTQLLGSNGWHSNTTILGGKQYVNDAVISSNFQTDSYSESWITFAELFKNRYHEEPDRVAAPLGYDAANLIIHAIEKNVEQIHEIFKSVKGYRGISGIISFDNEAGVNSESAIIKISGKRFVRIQ